MIGRVFRMRRIILLGSILLIANAAVQMTGKEQSLNNSEPVPVNFVDLKMYAGVWYEIGKIPNTFQRKCAMNTTATYRLRDDGDIDVTNRCTESDGSESVANGIARVVDLKTNSKLEVSFVNILGLRLFWGDYWIIGLDRDYRYAVVGTPSRKYGWILSRTPALSSDDLNVIDGILAAQGYNPKDFVKTEQTAGR